MKNHNPLHPRNFFYMIKILPASEQRNDAAATTHTKICNFHIRKFD